MAYEAATAITYGAPPVVATAVAAGGLLASVVGLRSLRGLRKLEGKTESATLEARLDQLSETMKSSARLLEQVSAEIDARSLAALRIKEEAETAERLATLNDEQRQAITRLVRAEVQTDSRRIFRLSLVANLAFFAAGALVTFFVTLFVHPA